MIDSAVLFVSLGSFIAAFVNAAFATGGVYILLFSSLAVLPVTAAIALQSTFAAASLIGRIYFFWSHIDWRLMRMFALGGILGVTLGARTFVALPEAVILTLLGLFMLLLIWLPKLPDLNRMKHPFVFIGVLHSYIGTVFGVGGVLQPLMLRTKLTKLQLTGTLASCMFALDVMKVAGYGSIGFNYFDYIPHIVGATLAGFTGTWLGKRTSHRVSEELFRTVFRVLVTLVALHMIYRGLTT